MSVTIKNYAYQPATLTAKAGTKVSFTNQDSTAHTVTADDGSFDLGTIGPGQTKSTVFKKPGSFPYHCDFHAFMHGQLIVSP